MQKLIHSTVVALLASLTIAIAAPADKDALESKEKAAWQAFKDQKLDDFRKMVDADAYRGLYADGIVKLDEEVKGMKEMTVKSFSLSDFDITSTDADTAIVTYKVKMEFSFDGKDTSETAYAASVWQKRNGEWHVIFHSNVAEKKPASAK